MESKKVSKDDFNKLIPMIDGISEKWSLKFIKD